MKIFTFDVNELDFDNVGDWPAQARYFAMVVVILAVLFLGYIFLVGRQLSDISLISQNAEKSKQDWARILPRIDQLDHDKKTIVRANQLFSGLLKQVPRKINKIDFFDRVSAAGVESGVKFKLLKPLGEVKDDLLFAMPIQITATGNYHQLATFMSRLANFNQFITMRKFTIRPVKSESEESKSGKNYDGVLRLKMLLSVYHKQPTRQGKQ